KPMRGHRSGMLLDIVTCFGFEGSRVGGILLPQRPLKQREEFLRCAASLTNDGVVFEWLIEDSRSKLEELLHSVARVGCNRRRGSDRAQGILPAEARGQSTDQTGDVSALGPVVGMQFIEDEVAQGARLVVLPERLIRGTQK